MMWTLYCVFYNVSVFLIKPENETICDLLVNIYEEGEGV